MLIPTTPPPPQISLAPSFPNQSTLQAPPSVTADHKPTPHPCIIFYCPHFFTAPPATPPARINPFFFELLVGPKGLVFLLERVKGGRDTGFSGLVFLVKMVGTLGYRRRGGEVMRWGRGGVGGRGVLQLLLTSSPPPTSPRLEKEHERNLPSTCALCLREKSPTRIKLHLAPPARDTRRSPTCVADRRAC